MSRTHWPKSLSTLIPKSSWLSLHLPHHHAQAYCSAKLLVLMVRNSRPPGNDWWEPLLALGPCMSSTVRSKKKNYLYLKKSCSFLFFFCSPTWSIVTTATPTAITTPSPNRHHCYCQQRLSALCALRLVPPWLESIRIQIPQVANRQPAKPFGWLIILSIWK